MKRELVLLTGMSGSGKSVSCYALLGLLPRATGRIEGGTEGTALRDHVIFGNVHLILA